MIYGKSENGSLVLAPRPITENGRHIFTNDPKVYAERGWYPVVYTTAPECPEDSLLSSQWETIDGKTVQRWKVKKVGESDES